MRVEYSNKGHQDSGSYIVFVRSYLRILKRDALLRRLSIWIFSRHKKALVSDLIQELPDGNDSQVIPEENWNQWVRSRGLAFIQDFSSDSLLYSTFSSFLESLTYQSGKSLRSGYSRNHLLRIRCGAILSVSLLLS